MLATPRTTTGPGAPPSASPAGLARGGSGAFPYGQRASRLLEELRRAEWLPCYDEEGVRHVLEECRALEGLMGELAPGRDVAPLAGNVPLLTTLLALDHAKERNKRCLMAYHQFRMEAMETLFWERGMAVLDKRHADKLSSRELDYYREYVDLMSEVGMDMDMDLLADMTPPKDLVMEVRALCDYGDVMTEFGCVRLTKDSTHFMRRVDAEPLIRQNVLEQISSS